MTRRVAITGLGVVTPVGNDVPRTWEALLAGRSGAGPITRFDPAQSPVKFACEVKGFEPARFLDKKEIRRYDLFAQFALGAAAQISMRYGVKGPNYCTVSACASSAHSVGDALELIRHDRADIMIAGGAEAAITPLAVASFANMKALSERNDSPETASRPF